MRLLTKDELKELHPDFNGGDTSRVAELTRLVESRRAEAMANRLCACGCGERLKSVAHRHNGTQMFLNALHYRQHRFYSRKLAL